MENSVTSSTVVFPSFYFWKADFPLYLLRSSLDDRILWIRSGIEIMWLIEHVANGGQLLT